jgi:hypothetical protein
MGKLFSYRAVLRYPSLLGVLLLIAAFSSTLSPELSSRRPVNWTSIQVPEQVQGR